MKCPITNCEKEMKKTVCKFVTVYQCPHDRHGNVYEWAEMFFRNNNKQKGDRK